MQMSIREAINQTLHQEMERDERVIVLGEDVASDQGGVYGITDGLPAKFGLHRQGWSIHRSPSLRLWGLQAALR